MKLLIFAACIFVAAGINTKLEDELKETVIHMLMDCKRIVGASDGDIYQYSRRIAPNSTAGKCMISCMNKKFKIQDENGKISHDAVIEAAEHVKGINKELYDIILNNNDKCIHEVIDGRNECDIAARWFTCISKAEDDAGFTKDLIDE